MMIISDIDVVIAYPYCACISSVFSRPYWVVRSRLSDVLSSVICLLSVCNVLYCG